MAYIIPQQTADMISTNNISPNSQLSKEKRSNKTSEELAKYRNVLSELHSNLESALGSGNKVSLDTGGSSEPRPLLFHLAYI